MAIKIHGHHSQAQHHRLAHVVRVAWVALLVILLLLVFAPKAGGTRELLARGAVSTA